MRDAEPADWCRLGRASYATYVLHPLLLTAIMALFASLALAPELTFLVVAGVTVPVCFLGRVRGNMGPCHLQGTVTAGSWRMRCASGLLMVVHGTRRRLRATVLIVAG